MAIMIFFLAFGMTHLSQENTNIVSWHGCMLVVEVKLYHVYTVCSASREECITW